jgi:hypothetical protein
MRIASTPLRWGSSICRWEGSVPTTCTLSGSAAAAGWRVTATIFSPLEGSRFTTSRPTFPVAPVIRIIANSFHLEREFSAESISTLLLLFSLVETLS